MAEAVFRSLVTESAPTTSTDSTPPTAPTTSTNPTSPTSTNTTNTPNRIFVLDSAGTDAYHINSPADPRTMHILAENGISDYSHSARRITEEDFERFDYIIGMDNSNINDLRLLRNKIINKKRKKKGGSGDGEKDDGEKRLAELRLFGSFGGRGEEEVVDPYYGEGEGFEIAFEQVQRFGRGFLRYLRGEGL